VLQFFLITLQQASEEIGRCFILSGNILLNKDFNPKLVPLLIKKIARKYIQVKLNVIRYRIIIDIGINKGDNAAISKKVFLSIIKLLEEIKYLLI
jgi:hypothetical protein